MSWYSYRLQVDAENPTPQIDISGVDSLVIESQGPWPTGASMTVEVSVSGDIWTALPGLSNVSPSGPQSWKFDNMGGYRFLRLRATGTPPVAWCNVGVYRRSVV